MLKSRADAILRVHHAATVVAVEGVVRMLCLKIHEVSEAHPWKSALVLGRLSGPQRCRCDISKVSKSALSGVEGLPWVPARPTLGSRFFSGL